MVEILTAPWRGVRDDVADDENGRTAVDLFDQRRQVVQRSDSDLRGGTKTRGNSRHHRIGNTGFAQRFHFLAAAAKDKRIAALETHRALPRLRSLDQQSVDRILSDARLADAAADRHA